MAVASRQHGVVSSSQLLAAGLSRRVVDGLRAGRYLRVLHRGVYQVGAVAGPWAREMAAVLACGPGAVVSHWSAAPLGGLLAAPPPDDAVHVLVPWDRARVRPGIRVHRARDLSPGEVTTRDGVVERDALTAMLAKHTRHAGHRALALIIGSGKPVPFVRSEAERILLAIILAAGLPEPRVNATVRGFEVDFYWPAQRLIVEVDGYAYHGSRDAFRRDRRRDAALTNAGLRVVRFTWEDLTETPQAVLATIAQALVVR